MKRLTDSNYWNKTYAKIIKKEIPSSKKKYGIFNSFFKFSKSFLRRFVVEAYASHLFWNIICPRYLPKGPAKILEVGCAPGSKLIRFAETFGYEPYGIDFSESGIEETKNNFILNGFNSSNVFCADFFDDYIISNYKEYFDVVVSMGFIEHFTEVRQVIERHLQLLREGGVLLISIPNLKGINYLMTYLIDKKNLGLHNVNIMDLKEFISIFQKNNLEKLLCCYYGIFNSGIWVSCGKSDSKLAKVCYRGQQVIDYCLMKLIPLEGYENRFISPYILYIGKKRSNI